MSINKPILFPPLNRNDTIDSKILKNYGMFLNRHNPSSVYIKSRHQAFESISEDLFKMNIISRNNTPGSF